MTKSYQNIKVSSSEGALSEDVFTYSFRGGRHIIWHMRELKIHSIQAAILRQLFRKDDLRFAELNADSIPSDQFSYHLRQLLKLGFIEKTAEGRYRLSGRGKSRGQLLYPNKDGFIEQGFLAVRVVLTKIEGGKTYFLMQDRELTPYKNKYSTPGDKIFYGEDVQAAAIRAMQTQTGLDCDVELHGVRHIKDEYEGVCMQDKYFFIFSATNPRGKLLARGRTGKNLWLTYDEVESSGRSIHGGLEILRIAQEGRGQINFSEATYKVETY